MRTRIIVLLAAACAASALAGGALASGHSASRQHSQHRSLLDRELFAVLSGRNEVGTDNRRGAGDPDGRGSFTATVDRNGGTTQLCFGITIKNVDTPVAAHIHKARPNSTGPIVVPLTPPSSGDPGASSGCVTVDPALANAILKNPHKYYANVHTAAFPMGAARGQLFAKTH
jgi:hypothetical protein